MEIFAQGTPSPPDSLSWVNLVASGGAWALLVWLLMSWFPKVTSAFDKALDSFRAEIKSEREICEASRKEDRTFHGKQFEMLLTRFDQHFEAIKEAIQNWEK